MPYPLKKQERDFWCWAAVSQSVEKFFNPQSILKQCEVANRLFNPPTECCGGNKNAGNIPAELQAALKKLNRFQDMFEGRLTFAHVRDFVRSHYPVCARIGWYFGGGHFVVITGYAVSRTGEPFVMVADPQLESGIWSFDEFAYAYYGMGKWTHTYLVRE